MSLAERSYMGEFPVAEEAAIDVRAQFIKRTYSHLFGAVLAFVALTSVILHTPMAETMANAMGGNWIIVLIAFMVVAWVADRWAQSDKSTGMQYLGLGLYVVAEAVIFTRCSSSRAIRDSETSPT